MTFLAGHVDMSTMLPPRSTELLWVYQTIILRFCNHLIKDLVDILQLLNESWLLNQYCVAWLIGRIKAWHWFSVVQGEPLNQTDKLILTWNLLLKEMVCLHWKIWLPNFIAAQGSVRKDKNDKQVVGWNISWRFLRPEVAQKYVEGERI